MKKIGIFYGSSTGNTEIVAEKIQQQFGEANAELINVDVAEKSDIEQYPYLIFGTSTWGVGDLQDDWEVFLEVLQKIDLSQKKIALFGLGDQEVYSESFVDGMGILYEKIANRTTIVGTWPATEYHFYDSKALVNGNFVGLPVDYENEKKLSGQRIMDWVEELKKEFV